MAEADKTAALEAYRKAVREHQERSEELQKCACRRLACGVADSGSAAGHP